MRTGGCRLAKYAAAIALGSIAALLAIWGLFAHFSGDRVTDSATVDETSISADLVDLMAVVRESPSDISAQDSLISALWWYGKTGRQAAFNVAREMSMLDTGTGRLTAAAAYHASLLGRSSIAEDLAQRAIGEGFLDRPARLGIGRALYCSGDYQLAVQYLKDAGYITPDPEALWLLVRSSHLAEEAQCCETVLRERIQRDSSEWLQSALVQCLVSGGKYREALELTRELQNESALDMPSFTAAVFAAFEDEQLDLAEKMVASDPWGLTPDHGLLLRALLAAHRGRFSETLDYLRPAARTLFYASGPPGDEWLSEPAAPTVMDLWEVLATRFASTSVPALQVRGIAHVVLGEDDQARDAFAAALAAEAEAEPAKSYLSTGSLEQWATTNGT